MKVAKRRLAFKRSRRSELLSALARQPKNALRDSRSRACIGECQLIANLCKVDRDGSSIHGSGPVPPRG
jgi:hypothetical protein